MNLHNSLQLGGLSHMIQSIGDMRQQITLKSGHLNSHNDTGMLLLPMIRIRLNGKMSRSKKSQKTSSQNSVQLDIFNDVAFSFAIASLIAIAFHPNLGCLMGILTVAIWMQNDKIW